MAQACLPATLPSLRLQGGTAREALSAGYSAREALSAGYPRSEVIQAIGADLKALHRAAFR